MFTFIWLASRSRPSTSLVSSARSIESRSTLSRDLHHGTQWIKRIHNIFVLYVQEVHFYRWGYYNIDFKKKDFLENL